MFPDLLGVGKTMALSQKTNDRGGKGSSLSGFHVAVLMVHAVGFLSLSIGPSSSRQPPAERPEPPLPSVNLPSFIDSSRSAHTQPNWYSFPVPSVPLKIKVPVAPQWDTAILQRELRDIKPSSQENTGDNYVVQIQPYFLQPQPYKIAEPLKTAVPLKFPEKIDMNINLVPLQFTQRFQPSMRTDAPPAK